MEWIQGIQREDDGNALVFVDSTGSRRLGPFKEIRSKATRAGNNVLRFEALDLAEAQVFPGEEYVRLAGLRGCDGSGQLVFAVQARGMRLLLPAATVLLGVFGTPVPFANKPLEAYSLDRLFVQTFENDDSKITFSRDAAMGKYAASPWFLERLRWLSAFPSGRRFWSSIYDHAQLGELGVRMPNIRVSGTVVGKTLAGTFLGSRLHIDSLVPTESPLQFAAVLQGHTFNVKMPSAVRPTLRARDDTIISGRDGWRLTDVEWEGVVSPLLSNWSKGTGRARLGAILEKLATGERFDPSFVSGSAANWFCTLKRSGKWDEIKRALIAHRCGQGADCPQRLPVKVQARQIASGTSACLTGAA